MQLPKFINEFEIIKDLGIIEKRRWVIFKCKVCKQLKQCRIEALKIAKGCGCFKPKVIVCSYKKSHSRLFRIYRCVHRKNNMYGPWKESANSFCEWALNNGYQDNLSLCRENKSKGYNPNNCTWVTLSEKNRSAAARVLNKEIVQQIRAEDRNMSIKDISEKYRVNLRAIANVMYNRTWANI